MTPGLRHGLAALAAALVLLIGGPVLADAIPRHLQLLAADSVKGAETDIRTLPNGERAYAILRRAGIYNLPWDAIVLPTDTEGAATSHTIEGLNEGEFIRLEWDPENATYRTVVYDDGSGGNEPFMLVLTSDNLRESASTVERLQEGEKGYLAWARDVSSLGEDELNEALARRREPMGGDWIDQEGLRWTVDVPDVDVPVGTVARRSVFEWPVTLTRHFEDGTPQSWNGRLHLVDGIAASRRMSDVRTDTRDELPMEVRRQVVTERWSRPIDLQLNVPETPGGGEADMRLGGYETGWHVTYDGDSYEISRVHDAYRKTLELRRPTIRQCNGQEEFYARTVEAAVGILNEIDALEELNDSHIVALNEAIWSNFESEFVIYGETGDEWTIASVIAEAWNYVIREGPTRGLVPGADDIDSINRYNAEVPARNWRATGVYDAVPRVIQRNDYEFLTHLNDMPVIARSAVITYDARTYNKVSVAQEAETDSRVAKLNRHIRDIEAAIAAFRQANPYCTVAPEPAETLVRDLQAAVATYEEVQQRREDALDVLSSQLVGFDRETNRERRPLIEQGVSVESAYVAGEWDRIHHFVTPRQLDQAIARADEQVNGARDRIREHLEAMGERIVDFNQAFSRASASGALCGTCGEKSPGPETAATEPPPEQAKCEGEDAFFARTVEAAVGILNEIGALEQLNDSHIVALNEAIWSNFESEFVIYGETGDEWSVPSEVLDAIHYVTKSDFIRSLCPGCEEARGPRAEELRRQIPQVSDMISRRDDYRFLTSLNGLPVITRSAVYAYDPRPHDETGRAQALETRSRVDKIRRHVREVEAAVAGFRSRNAGCTVSTEVVDNFIAALQADLAVFGEARSARDNAIHRLSRKLESFDRITQMEPHRRPALEPGITIGHVDDPLKWSNVRHYVAPIRLDRAIAHADDLAGTARRQAGETLEAMGERIVEFNQAFSHASSSGALCGTCGGRP